MLQSLFRPVLTPLMRGMFDAPIASARAWSPLALWPNGAASPGMWISPSLLTASFNDYLGTTPVATPGTVADSANPVGLALDIRAGATAVTDPGNHMLQATSAARPLESARVNLLTYSDDFSNSAWQVFGGPAKVGAAPFAGPSGSTAYEFSMGSTGGAISSAGAIYQSLSAQNGLVKVQSIYVRAKTGTSSIRLSFSDGSSDQGSADLSISDAAWTRLTFSSAVVAGALWNFAIRNNVAGNSGNIYVADAQFETGTTPSNYQRVGADSDYTATGFPQYLKFDGVDDALSSATFAAGTLTSSMDCLIAVRRDSAADTVCGLYDPSNTNRWFAAPAAGSSARCVALQPVVGNPTVWVDGTQLTGGTDVTRGTLHTALTAGNWHILELRGLDLSTWTAAGVGGYTSYGLNGALGGIELFASGQDANRDKARARMAAYFGVTLP